MVGITSGNSFKTLDLNVASLYLKFVDFRRSSLSSTGLLQRGKWIYTIGFSSYSLLKLVPNVVLTIVNGLLCEAGNLKIFWLALLHMTAFLSKFPAHLLPFSP